MEYRIEKDTMGEGKVAVQQILGSTDGTPQEINFKNWSSSFNAIGI